MNFVLYSLNFSPELTGIGKYNGEMCPVLVELGGKVDVLTAPPYYPEWKIPSGYSVYSYSKLHSNGISIVRCPLYVPSKVTTVKRLVHLSSFALSSGLALFGQLFKKPDVIFVVQPTFFCAPMALLVAKLTGAKAVMHIQDFEIDAMFGLGMMDEGALSKVVRRVESFILKRFDLVSSISFTMLENAKRKGVDADKLLFFPNWADINFVNPNSDGNIIKQEFGFTPDDIVVLYAGNIGAKQGLDIVLSAAEAFLTRREVKFLFVGAGAYVDELRSMVEQKGLSNVFFKPLQPWRKVPEMLAMADVHLVVQKTGAADAVLPSKLTNILSAGGHALVTAESHTELGQLSEKYPGIFELVEPESDRDFISGLERLLSRDLSSYNQIARQYAEQYLDKEIILSRFYQDMQDLIAK
jgi:colanic acid biosynthesis glycosyl transferase WcaI